MGQGTRRGGGVTLIIAIVMALFAAIKYYGSTSVNPVTNQKQHVAGISPQQEVALGLQAAPEMVQQYGGEAQNGQAAALVNQVGNEIVQKSDAAKSGYPFKFHLLEDDKTINAFALPGGQVFITEALMKKLRTRGELAGVLGHEVGHVVARHSAQQIAKQQFTQGLTGAAVLASYDPDNPNSARNAAIAAVIGNLVSMKFGRNDELEADKLGVRYIAESGYDPRAMIGVMEVLKASAGGARQPEFFSTHPNPDNRVGHIKEAIQAEFPQGIPQGLQK